MMSIYIIPQLGESNLERKLNPQIYNRVVLI